MLQTQMPLKPPRLHKCVQCQAKSGGTSGDPGMYTLSNHTWVPRFFKNPVSGQTKYIRITTGGPLYLWLLLEKRGLEDGRSVSDSHRSFFWKWKLSHCLHPHVSLCSGNTVAPGVHTTLFLLVPTHLAPRESSVFPWQVGWQVTKELEVPRASLLGWVDKLQLQTLLWNPGQLILIFHKILASISVKGHI